MKPTFPADAFARMKDQQLSGIDDAQTQPRHAGGRRVQRARLRQAPIRPLRRSARRTIGREADRRRLQGVPHRRRSRRTSLTVVVVGDFKTDEMVEEDRGAHEGLEEVRCGEAGRSRAAEADRGDREDHQRPERGAGPRLHRPARHHAQQPGLLQAPRHGQRARHRAGVHRSALRDPPRPAGTGLHRAARPSRARPAWSRARSPATSARSPRSSSTSGTASSRRSTGSATSRRPSEEVEDAKKYLLGSLPFRFTTLSAVAGQLLAAERYGLGFDFLEKYKKEVAAVTPADVQAVAKKYLDPKTLDHRRGRADRQGRQAARREEVISRVIGAHRRTQARAGGRRIVE